MKIPYLDNQDLVEEPNFDALKISKSKGDNDKDYNFVIVYPNKADKRYYWDGVKFGLHISDDASFDDASFNTFFDELAKQNLLEKCEVLYIGRTNIINFGGDFFANLTFLHLSENENLVRINVENLPNLEVLNASLCPRLEEIAKISLGNSIKKVDLDKAIFEKTKNKIEEEIKEYEITNYELEGLAVVFVDLGNSDLKEIPKEILNFKALENLSFGLNYADFQSNNKKSKGKGLPNDFSNCKNISILKSLNKLKSLSFNSCNLNNLNFLEHFPFLELIDITGNKNLKANDFTMLKHCLPNLKRLFLGYCNINDRMLKEVNFSLAIKLEKIFLHNNQISDLEFLNQFNFSKKRIHLYLNHNQINNQRLYNFLSVDYNRSLLLKWSFENHFSGAYITDNSIEEGIKPYFDEQDNELKVQQLKTFFKKNYRKDDEIIIKRLKLVLLGNTRAGKTTLYDILKNDTKSVEESTHGINIFEIEDDLDNNIPKVLIKGYDFGGQDYYHSTHTSYFSSNNTLYFLIFRNDWDDAFLEKEVKNKKNQTEIERVFPLKYWLDGIQTNCNWDNILGNDENKVNVEIFQNIYKGANSQYINLKELNRNSKIKVDYCEKFNFKEEKENNTIIKDKLLKIIKDYAKETPISKSRYEAIKKLKYNNKTGILLRTSAFESIKDEEKRDSWLNLAHNTFEIIDFNFLKTEKEIPTILKKYIITDIEKFNGYIFKILEKKSDGYFTKKEAKERLKPKIKVDDEIDFVLAFMIYYDIIFINPVDNTRYICPAFLEKTLNITEKLFSKTFDKPIIKYRFHSYFHANIFTKVVVKFTDKLLHDKKDWKLVLKKNYVFLFEEQQEEKEKKEDKEINEKREIKKDSYLFIEFGYEKSDAKNPNLPYIKIFNHGKFGVTEKFIENSLKEIDTLIDYEKNKENIEKLIYNKHKECIDFKLLSQEIRNVNNKASNLLFYNGKLYRKGDFKQFLPIEERKKMKMKKIFISYSKFDETYKEEFIEHLATLKSQDLIETFDDRNIEMGDKFDRVIKQKIEECDYFICLVSRYFLNVNYIFEEEFPYALEHKKKIIPIIIRPCDWYDMPIGDNNEKLGDWNAHNKANVLTLKPTIRNEKSQEIIEENTSNERDAMWLKLIKEIRTLIQSDETI